MSDGREARVREAWRTFERARRAGGARAVAASAARYLAWRGWNDRPDEVVAAVREAAASLADGDDVDLDLACGALCAVARGIRDPGDEQPDELLDRARGLAERIGNVDRRDLCRARALFEAARRDLHVGRREAAEEKLWEVTGLLGERALERSPLPDPDEREAAWLYREAVGLLVEDRTVHGE